ncbi:MAG: photosynthetic complex putative assembly protein PuhB [Pseudomonadota bacterium]
MNTQRKHDDPDFKFEPVLGLPEHLPKGEEVLWQGRPDWWVLAKEALVVRWVIGYFVLLAFWRVGTLLDQGPFATVVTSAVPFLACGAVAAGILMLMAYVLARTTVYTITNRRVVMRIGAALTITLNLPFKQIQNAELDLRKSGTGTIALDVDQRTRLSYLVCWPHVRPWAIRHTKPALRCIRDAQKVGALLAEVAEAELNRPQVVRTTAQSPQEAPSSTAPGSTAPGSAPVAAE